MKVLIIGPFPPPIDGCSNANKVLYANLLKRGISCEVINTNSRYMTNDQGRNFSFRKAAEFLRNYRDILRLAHYDLIYLTPGQTFYGVAKYAPFIIASLFFNKPYLFHLHGNFLGRQYELLRGLKRKLFFFLVSRAAAGIVLTESLKQNFKGLLAPDKVFVVTNFVEDELFSAGITKKADKLRILYLSNLMREKGILDFLDALIELDKRQIAFEAYVAGAIEKKVEKEVLARLHQLKEKLTYFGVVTGVEKRDLLIHSNVFILPTYYTMEGLPISLLEAIATGNIIISTRHAGIAETVTASHGFLVEKKSPQAIVDCIAQINSDLCGHIQRYSGPNMAHARTSFTEKKYADSILKIMGQTFSNRAKED